MDKHHSFFEFKNFGTADHFGCSTFVKNFLIVLEHQIIFRIEFFDTMIAKFVAEIDSEAGSAIIVVVFFNTCSDP